MNQYYKNAPHGGAFFCGRGRVVAPTVVYREVPVIAAGHMGPALRNVY